MMRKPSQQPGKGPEKGRPAPAPGARPGTPAAAAPSGNPREVIDLLAGQIQGLATRLESLRAQGAGQTTEFRQLEQLLNMVQDKLLLAQNRLERSP